MLAADASEAVEKLQFPGWVSPKLDGIRAFVNEAGLYSRSCKLIPNWYTQSRFGTTTFNGLDGELAVGEPIGDAVFRHTQSATSTREGEPDVKLWVFDYWNDPKDRGFNERIERLQNGLAGIDPALMQHIRLVPQIQVANLDDLMAAEDEFVTQGYEGAMYRRFGGRYKFGRSTLRECDLAKVKRFLDGEAVVIGAEELMHNENEAYIDTNGLQTRSSHKSGKVASGMLGKFIVRDLFTEEVFKIGTGRGLTLKLRKELWEAHLARNTLVSKIVKYRKASVGEKDKPRQPVWHGFRDLWDMS